jgi:anti-repressor protein
MNEIININYNEEQPTVLGRDLHKALGVKTAYKDWFPRMCEYGFSEGKDFNPLKNERVQNEGNRAVTRQVVDHQLTIPMAKEICMLQRSDKGKEFRQYFLKIEEQWNTPELVMARALKLANRKIDEITTVNLRLTEKIERDKPNVEFAKTLLNTAETITIGDLAKLAKQNGKSIGRNRLFGILRKNGYLIRGGNNKNSPTQKAMELGLFKIKENLFVDKDGIPHLQTQTVVTPKGQKFLLNKLLFATV